MLMFTTPRLQVRTWRDSDLQALQEILGDPLTMQHWPQPLDAAAVEAWLERSLDSMRRYGCARWCCERLQDGAIIGDVGIMVKEQAGERVNDLGYIVHAPFWRQGYALEAATGVIAWAREKRLPQLSANMAVDNAASVATAERLGMQRRYTFTNQANLNKQTYWYTLDLQG